MKDLHKQTTHWRKSADRSWQSAMILFDNKKYSDCLFFCHLAIEKLIKAIIIAKSAKEPAFIHDLNTLAKQAKIKCSQEQSANLRIITTFNIAGRYSNYKYDFYKKCTPGYTQKNLDLCKNTFLWLKKESHKK